LLRLEPKLPGVATRVFLLVQEIVMPVSILLAAVLALAPVPVSKASDDKQDGLDQLRGSWSVMKGDAQFEAKRLIFDGNKVTVVFDEDKKESKIKVVSDAKPAQIDILNREEKWLGIYEISGDTLRICFSEKGNKRPDKFENGKGLILVTLKRDKK
jgi:uncharacterized protein (TIGR03067 family)